MAPNEFWIRFRGKDVDASLASRKVRDSFKGLGKEADAASKRAKTLGDLIGSKSFIADGLKKISSMADLSSQLGFKVTSSMGDVAAAARGAGAGLAEAAEGGAGFAMSAGLISGSALGIAVGLAAAETGIVRYTAAWARGGRQTLQTASIMGMATGDLQSLRGAGDAVGVSMDGVDGSLSSLAQTIQNGLIGSNHDAYLAMKRLNLEVRRTKDGSIDARAMLLQLADAYTKLPNAQARARAVAVFGVDPRLLMKGSAGIRAGEAATRARGDVNSLADLAKADAETAKLTELHQRWEGLQRRIKVGLSPVADIGLSIANMSLSAPSWASKSLSGGAGSVASGFHSSLAELERDWSGFADRFPDISKRISESIHDWETSLANAGGGMARVARHAAGEVEHAAESAYHGVGGWARHTLGFRNNNPGNIRGKTGEGGFAHYSSMGNGLKAMGGLISTYDRKYGLDTIDGIENRYAPRSENNTEAAIERIEHQTGWKRNQHIDLRLPENIAKLEQAMINVEQGQQPFTREEILAALTTQQPDQLGASPGAATPGAGQPAPSAAAPNADAGGGLVSKHQMDVFLHGLPSGARVVAKSSGDGRASVRIGRSMPSDG